MTKRIFVSTAVSYMYDHELVFCGTHFGTNEMTRQCALSLEIWW